MQALQGIALSSLGPLALWALGTGRCCCCSPPLSPTSEAGLWENPTDTRILGYQLSGRPPACSPVSPALLPTSHLLSGSLPGAALALSGAHRRGLYVPSWAPLATLAPTAQHRGLPVWRCLRVPICPGHAGRKTTLCRRWVVRRVLARESVHRPPVCFCEVGWTMMGLGLAAGRKSPGNSPATQAGYRGRRRPAPEGWMFW